MNDKLINPVFKRCGVTLPNPRFPLILDSNDSSPLNIGGSSGEVNGLNGFDSSGYWTNGTWYPYSGGGAPVTVTGVGTGTGPGNTIPAVPAPIAVGNAMQQVGPWIPAKTAAGDFLKIQYAEVEVRCAITRKMVPVGAPIMLLGGMVVSQEAFENWLEEHLSALLCRHQDLHTDNPGYDE
jgi:hypothetical protein